MHAEREIGPAVAIDIANGDVAVVVGTLWKAERRARPRRSVMREDGRRAQRFARGADDDVEAAIAGEIGERESVAPLAGVGQAGAERNPAQTLTHARQRLVRRWTHWRRGAGRLRRGWRGAHFVDLDVEEPIVLTHEIRLNAPDRADAIGVDLLRVRPGQRLESIRPALRVRQPLILPILIVRIRLREVLIPTQSSRQSVIVDMDSPATLNF